jgi:hypothetical protein
LCVQKNRFEQSDGQKRDESIALKKVDTAETDIVAYTGSYEFVDDKGKTWRVTFTADERGFLPKVEIVN